MGDTEMIELKIYHDPAPQGSKSYKGKSKSGHAILAESSKKVKPWREAVCWAAREHGGKITGPVGVRIVFTLRKPKTAPKTRKTWPDRKPDIDKLVRSTFDALTAAGTWEDDGRVVEQLAYKVFPDEGEGALDVPGALIQVWSVE
jgi:crossover junction endodeoxyribonuclease RusA